LRNNFFGRINGDGESDALAAGENGRVDPDHFSFEINQGASAVSGIDGGIGLNKIVIRPGPDYPTFGTDDAGRNRMVQAEGIADSHYPIADPELIGISEFYQLKPFPGFNLDQSQIGLGVPADDFGIEFLVVCQGDLDFIGVFNDMVVGQDMPFLVDNEP
jgi:hypothetical protein